MTWPSAFDHCVRVFNLYATDDVFGAFALVPGDQSRMVGLLLQVLAAVKRRQDQTSVDVTRFEKEKK